MPEFSQPFFPDRLSCVIFDIDGTLARSNDLIFASFNHVTRKYLGKELDPGEIIALFGPPEEGGLRKLLQPEVVADAMEDLCTFYDREHEGLVTLHEGIAEVLAFLADRRVPMAVFTGKGRRTATITLDRLGILGHFSLVVSGSDVQRHKPDPEGINTILRRFEVSADRALMVGDSLSDIRAAHAADVPVASVLWDCLDRSAVLQAGAEFHFHHASELLGWLRHQFVS